jgi:Tol biopolymer transport system component
VKRTALSFAVGALLVCAAAGAAPNGPGTIVFTSWRGGTSGIYSVRGDGTGPVKKIAASFPSGAEPSWSRDGTKIAFSVFTEAGLETNEIWVSTPLGGSPTRLTSGKRDENPSWSPNGKRIAFTRNDLTLWVMNANGSGQRKLLYGAEDPPSWSADGKRIAYGSNGRLFTISAEGGTPKRIANPQRQRRFDPVYSPDGRRIAYDVVDPNGRGDLYTMRTDGTGITRLTHTRSLEILAQPTWSPDGSSIVYSDRIPQSREALFVVRADGSAAPRRLTHPGKKELDGRAAWSPNGRTIVFQRGNQLWTIPARGGREHILRPVVFYANPDSISPSLLAADRAGPGTKSVFGSATTDIYLLSPGRNPRKLTSDPGNDRDPALSPDGSRVAFASDRDRRGRESFGSIYVVGANGAGLKLLVTHAGQPAWSPDGKLIAYTDGTDEPAPKIAVVRPNGTGAHDLTSADIFDDETSPAWSPDSKQLVFTRESGVFVMKANGTGLTKIAGKGSYHPTWSPDGKHIAVVRIDGLYSIDIATKAATKLIDDPSADAPDWR